MIDITQPVTNTLIFSTIGVLLLITALGIVAVKRASKKRKQQVGENA